MIVARTALASPPEKAAALRSVGPRLARFSAMGLILMWITGVAMIWTVFGGPENLPTLFWVKLFFVLTLTGAAITTELTYGQIKAGKVQAAARLPILGPIAGLSSMIAVIVAVFAFH
ncbi:MAG: hypothetical protein WDM79_08515 [Terricaulis sp.]